MPIVPRRAAVFVLMAVCVSACASTIGALDVSPDQLLAQPKLIEKLASSPLAYFRFINVPFANEVCGRFRGKLSTSRIVNLHGDAHIEQYAITDSGRGLTDFDDASSGPPVLDLVRFATSLHLVCRQKNWRDCAEPLIDALLRGYRSALKDTAVIAAEPRVVGRIRGRFKFDPRAYFTWVHSIIEPIAPEEAARLRESLAPYVEAMIVRDAALDAEYFSVEEAGYARIGIGSALSRKYVLRVRGASAAGDDDDVLEVKEISDLTGISCISREANIDPMRLIVAQARIAYEPYRLVGYVVIDGRYFGVRAWAKNYQELTPDDLSSQEEVAELAFDVGVQLGLGHPKYIATPMDRELRRDILSFLDAEESEIRRTAKNMAGEVVNAWEKFRQRKLE